MHRRDGRLIISATDLVGFLSCGHLTHLERAAADNLVRKPTRDDDPEVELLRRRGGMHEDRYLELLREREREICDLRHERVEGAERDPRSYEERAAETEAAMRRGEDVIFQATVFDEPWVGHPDFLLRKPSLRESGRGGELGRDFHYEVADTKLAHSAKASALIQICAYVEQVERIQGVIPERVCVVTGGAEVGEHWFRTAEMMAYYRHAKRAFERALDEEVAGPPMYPVPAETSYPDPVAHCQVCRWYHEYCRQQWRDDDALPLVAGISRRQRQALASNSVATMRALSELGEPLALEGLKHHQLESLRRVRSQAQLQVASRDLFVPRYELLPAELTPDGQPVSDRGLAALPAPSEGDTFFDIEGDPFAHWTGLDYLFGLWTAQGEWQCLWAMDHAQEKRAFEQLIDLFIDRLDRYPEMHVYHYAPYEPTALKRLASRHGTREEQVDRLLRERVLVDLYRVVRQGLLVGVESYSIKRLEPLYGFAREVELRDANSSIVEFERILEIGDPSGELKQMIEAYNRDDCVSTQRLRDWLEGRRAEYTDTHGGALPRPAAGEPISDELAEREQEVLELERRLIEGIPDEPEERTPEQRATWLLAQLLDWHRRENKSTWWRFYDLMGRTDDELFDEREPIAHLSYEGFVEATKQSNLHRYTFPPGQEHRVEPGRELHDPRLTDKTRTGSAETIDADNGVLEIKRKKSWTGPHPTAVVPLNIFRVPEQQGRLMDIGHWVADHGIDSPLPDHRAIRDLLLRRPPRLVEGTGRNLVGVGQTGTQAALGLVTRLDGATLPIQGPPGSGKTYSGARMILELVRAGRVVGITSNGHKVISNLLRAACEAAEEAGIELRAMQRGEESEVIDHRFVKRAKDNDVVIDAIDAGEVDVIAGTAWLWARDDMRGKIDTLFIDEAGQVALANVVATSTAARNIVLLGDPQQLDQPTQGVHPPGADRSALAHLLDGAETVAPDRGVFLGETWRMNDAITAYTSELFYEGLLRSVQGLADQRVHGADWLAGSGLRWVPVQHDGNTNASVEEAKVVAEVVGALVGRRWTDKEGRERELRLSDIVIVSPFNAHRLLIQEVLGEDAFVGTVDKFQGQEAPVSIYTMATSRPEDAPRGMDFLYSLNRLNVATSRARALAIVVASEALLRAVPKTPDQLRMVNGLCAFVEMAQSAPGPTPAAAPAASGALG